ncbi:gasdermin-E-like [Polymixia lowei]
MFSKATGNFVRQIDPEGSLIHVSRLNDSDKLVPTALVVKRNRFWFWQRPKYQPSDFTLNDLLLGDTAINPVVSETDFLTYQGTFGDILSGKLDAKAGIVSVNLEGRGSSKLQSSFGKLKKEEVDVKKLLQDSRLVDMEHVLVKQLEKQADVLAVLKARVLTTCPCSLTETHQKQGTCGGVLGCVGKLGSTVEICVNDNSSIEMDRNISLEIPPNTVIAYSLLELEIKKDGHYELCLQPSVPGGFMADSGTPSHDPFDILCVVDGLEWSEKMVPERAPLHSLHSDLQELERCLCPLAELPQSTRSTLFQKLREVLRDRATLSDIENTLEEWCRGDPPAMTELEDLSVSQSNSACAIVDLLGLSPANQIEDGRLGTAAELTATHLLISAMEDTHVKGELPVSFH